VDAWWAVSHGVAGLMTAAAGGLWLWKWRSIGRHFFFLFFFSLTVAYLDVFPVLSLHEYAETALVGLRVGPPAEIVQDYAIVQFYCLCFFQLPLVLGYFGLGLRPRGRRIVSNPGGSRAIAIASIVFSLLFLWVLLSEGLLMARVSVDLTPVLIEMPFFKFFVYRLFQESGVFLIGVLFFLAHFSAGPARQLVWAAWVTTVGAYGIWAVFNSRWSLLLLVVCSLGFWLAARGDKMPSPRVFARMASCVVLGAYLATIVVNVRRIGFEDRLSWRYFVPQGLGAFGDEQSYMRLNGIDLMARLLPGIEREGPALGAAWGSVGWYLRRFTDPKGFDEFRLSRKTTAKTYLMARYLGWDLTDYFSCTLTDLFGNFHVFGLLGGAVLLVMLLRFSASRFMAPRDGAALVLAVFVIVHAIVFDQEAVGLLFGWTKQLPILFAVLALRPFRVAAGRTRGRGAMASRTVVFVAPSGQPGGLG
jgi:hypothetical protein